MALQESGEMYLETILVLSQKNEAVRAIDIVDYMGFSKPSVSRAMSILKKDGYINVSENGRISLTDSGRDIAEKIFSRHNVLTEFLMKLGVPKEIAAEDACKIEHDISDESFKAIVKHTNNK